MTKKYEFVEYDTIKLPITGQTLHRIRALIDIPNRCKAGDLGGYIEHERNLSHTGTCWVSHNAKVFGRAWVRGSAYVRHNAKVCDEAVVTDYAMISDNAIISNLATVKGYASVVDNAQVFGQAVCCDVCTIRNRSQIGGNAYIGDSAEIFDTKIGGKAIIDGDLKIDLNFTIVGDVLINKPSDIVYFGVRNKNCSSMLIVCRSQNGGLIASDEYFGDYVAYNEFKKNVIETYDDKRVKYYKALFDAVEVWFDEN